MQFNVTNLLNFVVANLPEDLRVNLINNLSDTQFRETTKHSSLHEDENNFDLRSKNPIGQKDANLFQSYHEEL